MNNSKLSILRNAIIGIAVLLTAISLYCGYHPSWLFVDWTDTRSVPFATRNALEITSRWYPLKRSSVSLLCASDGAHLMLKSRLPLPDYVRENMRPSPIYSAHTEIILDWVHLPGGMSVHSFTTRSAIANLGSVDTIVSQPLRDDDQNVLIDWFRRGAPQGLTYAAFESGSGKLKAVATSQAVTAFIKQCASEAN